MSKLLVDRAVLEQAVKQIGLHRRFHENGCVYLDDVLSSLRAALEQPQAQSGGIPPNWKLVPVEPADSQIRAAQDTWWHACNCETYWDQIYAAMIAAAPQPPVVEQPQVEQDPDSDGRVMTVVYRNPARDDVQSFMDHPKAVWFGWCHAPYQRDDARAQLMRPKRQPLTDEEISDLWGMQVFRLTDLALANDFARDIERAHGIGGEA